MSTMNEPAQQITPLSTTERLEAAEAALTAPETEKSSFRDLLRDVLARVPGTSDFEARLPDDIRKCLAARLAPFNLLTALPEEVKERLRPHVARFEAQLSDFDARGEARSFWLQVLGVLIVSVLSIMVVVAMFSNRLDKIPTPDSSLATVLGIAILLVGMFLWVYIILWPRIMNKRSGGLNFSTSFQIAWVIVTVCLYAVGYYFLYAYYHNKPPNVWVYLLASFLRGAYYVLYMGSLLIVSLPLVKAFNYLVERRSRRLYPQATVCHSLMSALYLIGKTPDGWRTPDKKRELVSALEKAAACVERELRDELRAGDVTGNIRVSNTLDERAAALRELKQWVLTPKPDTHEHLLRRVADSFVAATEGHWDSLAAMTPPKVSLAEGVGTRTARTAKTLLKGALPVLALLALRRYGPPDSQITQYAAYAVVPYSIVTLLRLLDPNFDSTLESAKKAGINLQAG